MTNTPDEARLKELVKSAVAEALDERVKFGKEIPSVHPRSTMKVVLLWVLILVVTVGLYNLVERVAAR